MKQKTEKKITALTAAFCLGLSATTGLTACTTKKKAADNATTIEINYWKSGLGVDWLNNLIGKFEEKYPQYDVYLDMSSSQEVFANTIKLGAKDNSIDLYFTTISSSQYNSYFESLDDIVDYQWEGESKTIGEKINSSIFNMLQHQNGELKSLSYGGGLLSIAYNTNIVDGVNYSVPNTSDELKKLAARIQSDYGTDTYPFITFKEGGYWPYLYDVWLAQYNGLDWYLNTFNQLDGSSYGYDTPSKELLVDENKKTGRYQLLELLQNLYQFNYCYPGSSSADFTPQQTLFIKKDAAAMMANGTWLSNEMKGSSGGSSNIGFMKMPVFSAIIDNLSGEIKSDSQLSALVSAIDVSSNEADVPLEGDGYKATVEDVARVWEARHLMTSVLDEHAAVIPNYATAKEGAKEFLKFMYSDEMIHDYLNITHMPFPATPSDGEIDTTGWTEFELNSYKLYKESTFLTKSLEKCGVLTYAGAFAGIDLYNSFSKYSNPLTANDVWKNMQKTYNDKWEQYLYLAGIK